MNSVALPFRTNAQRQSQLKAREPLVPDWPLCLITMALVMFGLVMLYSTTGTVAQERFGDAFFYLKRQAAAAVIGFGLMVAAARIPLALVRKLSPWFLLVAVGLLVLTFIPGIGDAAGGAQRWVKLGPVRFQPAEFVKLATVTFLAGYWARHYDQVQYFSWGLLRPLLLVAGICAMLLKQPDFGSSSIIMLCALGMSLAAGVRVFYLGLGAAAAVMGACALIVISPYRMARIASFLSPESDVSGKGYQLIQSLIAVASGKFGGVGLGESQQKLFFLPAAHTDFIFAVVGEELGFAGCIGMMLLFVLFLWRGLWLASRVKDDPFKFVFSVGLTLVLIVPGLLNMGVVTGVLPTKGLVLPFVGYGGSSLLASMIAVGLLMGTKRAAARGE